MNQPTPHPILWTPERIKRFWDFESRYPERYFTHFSAGRVVRFAQSHLREANLVLDYGAGAGHLVELLFRYPCRIAAVDHSPDSLRTIGERFASHARFLGAFSPSAILAGKLVGCFDTIFLIETVEHLDDASLHETLANVRSLLSPNGIAIITTPYREVLDHSLLCCPECAAVFHRWQHLRSWDAITLRKTLEAAGLNIDTLLVRDFSTHPLIRFLKSAYSLFTRVKPVSNAALKLVALAKRSP